MKYYRTIFWTSFNPEIIEVEVERETDSTIWIDGVEKQKHTNYGNHFTNWQEAKDFLIRNVDNEVSYHYNRIDELKKFKQKVNNLTEKS